MLFLPPKKVSWTLLVVFFIFDAISSFIAIKYMGGKEGNPLIAPYVQINPLLFFPIMSFAFIPTYIIYFVLKKISLLFLGRFKFVSKILIEKIILASIVIFYFFTVVVNNSLFLLGIRVSWMLKPFLLVGIVMAIINSVSILVLYSKKGK